MNIIAISGAGFLVAAALGGCVGDVESKPETLTIANEVVAVSLVGNGEIQTSLYDIETDEIVWEEVIEAELASDTRADDVVEAQFGAYISWKTDAKEVAYAVSLCDGLYSVCMDLPIYDTHFERHRLCYGAVKSSFACFLWTRD